MKKIISAAILAVILALPILATVKNASSAESGGCICVCCNCTYNLQCRA